MLNQGLLRWAGLAGAVLALDQATKLAVVSAFRVHESVAVTPFFNLVLVYNRGAAFSMLATASGWQTGFFIMIALAAIVWIGYLLKRHPGETGFCFALTLILAGALGNVVDRIRLGSVIDFLDFHAFGWHWPAFNVADSAITCGALLLIWDGFLKRGTGPAGGPD